MLLTEYINIDELCIKIMNNKLNTFLQAQGLKILSASRIRRDQWVFSSTENRHFDSNSRYLFQYVYAYMPEIHPVYVMNDEKKREKLQIEYPRAEIVDANTLAGIRTVLESGAWFTSAGLPVYGAGLAKGRVIVNLWHGVPLKKIVLAEKRGHLLYRIIFHLIFSRNYTWVLTTSSRLIPIIQESFGVRREQVKVWGQPRNDCLFRSRKAQEALGGIYPDLPPFTKAVLYAPTHRENNPVKLFPFDDFNRQKLEEFLGREGILLFIRTHLYTLGNAQWSEDGFAGASRVFWLNEDRVEDVMEVLDAFDLLITDYSSIYIDFLLTGKPMLFLPYDKEAYLADRGLNFPYDKFTPGPKPDTFEKFCKQMRALLEGEDEYGEERRRANQFFNEIQKPCCEEICARVQERLRQ